MTESFAVDAFARHTWSENETSVTPLTCAMAQGKEADRVIKSALADYVVNSDPEGIDHNLKQRPLMTFVLCYVSAHLALDLLDEQQAEEILIYCEEKLD